MSAKPLVLVDGSSYLYRAFHALPALSTSRGEPTGAIHGFIAMLKRAMKDHSPDCLAVVFDAGTSFFRVAERLQTDEVHVFLSHAHLDHICGLTYFLPLLAGNVRQARVYGTQQTLETVQTHLFSDAVFPVLPAFLEFAAGLAGALGEVAEATLDVLILFFLGQRTYLFRPSPDCSGTY